MSTEYQNNHYVPAWYQKRFLPIGQINQELHYLDFKPKVFMDAKGVAHPDKAVRRQGFRHCFAEADLYTTRFGAEESRNIEKHFFGQIDLRGSDAVEHFANFTHASADGKLIEDLLMYMSTQKLRTIKGLEWLALQPDVATRQDALSLMISLRNLHCAVWAECVWLLADASKSATKFIVSDHPVTV